MDVYILGFTTIATSTILKYSNHDCVANKTIPGSRQHLLPRLNLCSYLTILGLLPVVGDVAIVAASIQMVCWFLILLDLILASQFLSL